jgi:hypothetical protein
MASVAEHLEQARHNEAFLGSLDLQSTPYLDWAVTIIFYAALHYLRALFADNLITNISRYGDMDKAFDRLALLKKNPTVYNDYRQLKDDSRDTRYNMWRPASADVVDFRDGELRRIRDFVGNHVPRSK